MVTSVTWFGFRVFLVLQTRFFNVIISLYLALFAFEMSAFVVVRWEKKLTFLFFQFFVLAPLNSFNQKIKVTFVALKMLNFMPELFCRIAKKFRNSDTVESANLNTPLNNCFLDKLRSIRRQIFNFKTKCKIFQKL